MTSSSSPPASSRYLVSPDSAAIPTVPVWIWNCRDDVEGERWQLERGEGRERGRVVLFLIDFEGGGGGGLSGERGSPKQENFGWEFLGKKKDRPYPLPPPSKHHHHHRAPPPPP